MKTILMLTDFSIRADNAADFALKIAQKTKSNLLLCNMFLLPFSDPLTAQMAWPVENYDSIEKESKEDLSALGARLANKLDYEYKTGDFRPEIEQFSTVGSLAEIFQGIIEKYDLLLAVISQHDPANSGSFSFEDHAKMIIEKANFPVLVVPESARFNGFKKIAFASDLSLSDVDVLHRIVQFAGYFDALVNVTHVNDENALDEHEVQNGRQFFSMVAGEINYPGLSFKALKSGSVTKGLDWLAENGDIDLLVLVHRKRNFFFRLLEGSVTHKMANHVKVPLFALPDMKVLETLTVK